MFVRLSVDGLQIAFCDLFKFDAASRCIDGDQAIKVRILYNDHKEDKEFTFSFHFIWLSDTNFMK